MTEPVGRLGKYELRGTLGRGAMGVVYDGWDPIIARRVAIKTVKIPDPSDEEAMEELARFRREAQAAGRLTHPNIVGVYDYGEAGDVAYIVMEFVDGPTLKSLMEKQQRMAMPEILRVMGDVLTGLAFSHARGIVHRDIKPANVMITSDGQAKIADFGIARIESSSMTQAGTVMGTPAYMSPEQFMGQTVDARTDIYSSGVLLYQLLTGERPFEGGMTAIMHKALNTDPPRPSEISVTSPAAMDAVVARAMAKRPENRWPNADAFAQAMRAAASAPAGPAFPAAAEDSEATMIAAPPRQQAAPPPTPAPPPPRQAAAPPPAAARKGAPVVPIAAGVVVLLAAAGGGAWWMLGRGEPTQIVAQSQAPTPSPAPAVSLPPATPVLPPPAQIQSQPVAPPPAIAVQPATPSAPVQAQPAPVQPPPPTQFVQPAAPTQPPPTQFVQPAPVQPPTPFVQPAAPVQPPPAPFAQPAPVQTAPPQPAPFTPPAPQPSPPIAQPQAPAPQPLPAPVVPPPQIALAPVAPPAPQPAPQPVQPAALPSAASLRTALSATLPGIACSLVNGSMAADRATVRGIVGRGAPDRALRDALNGALGNFPRDLRINSFDGPFCPALDVLRPAAQAFGVPGQLGVALANNATRLRDGELVTVVVNGPDFPAYLQVSFLVHDGTLAHLHPTPTDPSRLLPAGATMRLGDPTIGGPAWAVSPPFGTDVIIAIASSAPLFDKPRPDDEDTATYLRDLRAALENARRRGVRLAVDAWMLETVAR